jgi:hypothetical protein
MAVPDDIGQRFELRDAGGGTLGFFVPDGVLNGLIAERDSLRQQLAAAREEVEGLRKERDQLQAERDKYLEDVNYLLSEECPFNPWDFWEMKRNGIPFERVIAEVEQIANRKPSGG